MTLNEPPLRCKGGTWWNWSKSYAQWPSHQKIIGLIIILVNFLSSILAEPFSAGSVGIHIPGGALSSIGESRCPRVCTCNGLTVDCSHRGITQVPRKISADVERL